MTPERPSAYERLPLEAAARVDVACDGFEKAWKATRSGAAAPQLSNFLNSVEGPERTILAGELLAIDKACRERYGFPSRPENSSELDAELEYPSSSPTRLLRSRADVHAGRPADWPRVPGLELEKILGSGGMGVVFKARQTRLDREVAVKFLRDAHAADWEQRERFLQEARAVARLRHPNLVQLYEFGEAPTAGGITSQPYLVLEYVPGGSLADLMRGSPQRPKEAARIVETLADAIQYAHQQGVIHRDLKPANVLLQRSEVRSQRSENRNQKSEVGGLVTEVAGQRSEKGVERRARASDLRPLTSDLCPKITDFGLAKFLAGSDLTRTGDVLGTPGYMAPEQAAGKFGFITPAVDVYGLGAILYEAMTGRPPFQAETAPATVYQVQHEDPVTPRRLQPTVPHDLETICLKCLRKEPGRRYATAQELADDLRRFQAGESIRARPVGTAERIVVWCRRKPAVAGLLAALVLVFIAGASGVFWQWHRASRERDIARQENRRAERHLQIVRDRVKELDRLGHELLQTPGKYRTGQAVLNQALAFYRELLPEEGNDPRLRREAAKLYGQVGSIHYTLNQTKEAIEAWDHQAHLQAGLLKETPDDMALHMELANSHRWRGNAMRRLGQMTEAREAYDQAAGIHEELLRQSPDRADYQVEFANTLLNITSLILGHAQPEELEALYQRIMELYRSAVQAAPNNTYYKTELALGLEDQGRFFLNTGRGSDAEVAVREALEIHKKMLAQGQWKGFIERSTARSFISLGRIFAATGRTQKAEESYREAAGLLEQPIEESPEAALRRAVLAQTLIDLAGLIQDPNRRSETEVIHRRVISLYEKLTVDFPETSQYQLNLALAYLRLVNLLCEFGRQTEAAETLHMAVQIKSEDSAFNNELAWYLATGPEPRLRDAATALRMAKEAVAAKPESGNFRNTLGVALYRSGDDQAAVAELETAMSKKQGGDSQDFFFLAMAHWRLGNRDQARAWFDRAQEWMEKHKPQDDELRRFRAEAEATLSETANKESVSSKRTDCGSRQ